VVRRINLVPQEQRKRTEADLGMLILAAIGILVVGGVVLSYLSFSNTLVNNEDDLADMQAQNAQLQTQIAALAPYQELDQRRATVEQLVTTVYAGRTLVSEVLGDLSLVIPENVWLGTLNATAPSPPPVLSEDAAGQGSAAAETEGSLALVGNTYSFEDVARFLVRLEQIPAVSTVSLGSAGQATGAVDPAKKVRGFTLQTVIRNTQAPDTQLPVSQVEVEAR